MGKGNPGAGAVDAEERYRQYLSIRTERDTSRNKADHPVMELKRPIVGISSHTSS
jgi:hypothetical protein